jgi:hypothetical protein
LAPGANQSTSKVTHLGFLFTFFAMNAQIINRSWLVNCFGTSFNRKFNMKTMIFLKIDKVKKGVKNF